jgi:hypothetical protein
MANKLNTDLTDFTNLHGFFYEEKILLFRAIGVIRVQGFLFLSTQIIAFTKELQRNDKGRSVTYFA